MESYLSQHNTVIICLNCQYRMYTCLSTIVVFIFSIWSLSLGTYAMYITSTIIYCAISLSYVSVEKYFSMSLSLSTVHNNSTS